MKANFLATLILAKGIAGHAIPRHSSCKPAAPATGKAVYFLSNDAHDPMAPLPSTEQLIGLLRERSVAVTTHRHTGGHRITPDALRAAQSWLAEQQP